MQLEIVSCQLDEPDYRLTSINPISANIPKPEDLLKRYPEILNADTIVTDYNMGCFTGLDLASHLRTQGYKRPIFCFSSENFPKYHPLSLKQLSDLEVIIMPKEDPVQLRESIIGKLH